MMSRLLLQRESTGVVELMVVGATYKTDHQEDERTTISDGCVVSWRGGRAVERATLER